MARSTASFAKKEKEKSRLKKQQDKKEKAAERKANSDRGKSLEDMMAYIDADGNITSTPPDQSTPRVIDPSEIAIATPKQVDEPEDTIKTGTITFFNTSKGFGFIRDAKSQESIFFHVDQVTYQVKENDKVNYAVEKGPKGLVAMNVTKAG